MHKVAVIVGSIRKDSHNGKLARALERLAGNRLEFRAIRIDDLPLLNEDHINDPPDTVRRFKREVEECVAVLFVTPEHNRSVPAALKNAFDWGTRPWGWNSWLGKSAAIIGTSAGGIGTALAQANLRTMASTHVAALLGTPEAYIQYRDGLFASDGTVTDESTRAFLQTFVDNFVMLIERTARSREGVQP
jgi:chromate reductase, NAD(P)H dehydrogenase (quinone)